MELVKKYSIEQTEAKLDMSFANILDYVQCGSLPMYVYMVEWRYSDIFDDDDLLISHLRDNISLSIEHYKIPQRLSSSIRSVREEEHFSIPAPNEDDNPDEFKNITAQLRKLIEYYLEDFIMEFPHINEENWDDYLEYLNEIKEEESEELECVDDKLEYYERVYTSDYHLIEEGKIYEVDEGTIVHKDTFDRTKNLKNLLFKIRNGCNHFQRETFIPLSEDNLGNDWLSVKPEFIKDSQMIKFSDVYFVEDDVLMLDQGNKTAKKNLKLSSNGHTSKLIEYLEILISEFWTEYETDNPPTNEAMMARLAELDNRFWTKGNKDKPNRLAKYMAMITRPDDLK